MVTGPSCTIGARFWSTGLHYGFSLTVLVSFIEGLQTCSSLMDGPGNFSLYTVSTILQQTLTNYTLRAPRAVEGYNRSSRHISLVLWRWTVTFVTALVMQMVQECDARRSSHSIQRMAQQFSAQLQESLSKDMCATSCRVCMEVGPCILSGGVFEQAPQTDAN